MLTTITGRLGVIALTLAVGCSPDGERVSATAVPVTAPRGWGPIQAAVSGPWRDSEAELLNATLYFVRESLAPADPRRRLLELAHYLPLDAMAPEDGPTPPASEALFSVRTGNVYVKRSVVEHFPELASALAHELHHMERDLTTSINRMQDCDRERIAHAREADDVGRMISVLSTNPSNAARWLRPFELAQAKARSLSALYTSKFELFRLVQALDHVEGLREMPALYASYERCIDLAQRDLATEHREELALLDEMSASVRGSTAEAGVAGPLQRAREALAACAPLHDEVDRLRAVDPARHRR